MLEKIDLPQSIAKDYSADESATIQAVIDNSPNKIKKGLTLFEIYTDENDYKNYGVLVDTSIIDFEIATIKAADGSYSFFEV
ncbi:hypothetical protein CVPH_0189 [Abyssogena phaseoliformis symbiont OG214]|uniref:hypothetical protein n=1 Tax=Abyssogena phaseoliformis symbiont TaxID=596095 RepID=UPI00191613DF|nr:hypothetical protein [Abyssogena phaseoliformis symbiont]MBW5289459.1 hypothetical protein [Candidatus Ruthia sp. Apha_13_S6]BBB22356.1 hypothetical protein CVPH_0189 [Abyssogena phaseoliformis symbiont OG214]